MDSNLAENPSAELRCAFESCVLGDRSHFARLLASGPDFLDLLHRLSTADNPAIARPAICRILPSSATATLSGVSSRRN